MMRTRTAAMSPSSSEARPDLKSARAFMLAYTKPLARVLYDASSVSFTHTSSCLTDGGRQSRPRKPFGQMKTLNTQSSLAFLWGNGSTHPRIAVLYQPAKRIPHRRWLPIPDEGRFVPADGCFFMGSGITARRCKIAPIIDR